MSTGTPDAAGKAELGYLFRPQAWGFGYAAEAVRGGTRLALAVRVPGEPVVLFTQTAHTPARCGWPRGWGSPR